MEAQRLETDVLIIGAGAAGCRAAMEAHDRGARVLIATKGRFGYTGSTFFPLTVGLGYTSALPGGDGPELHYREIVQAGLGMGSPTLARILAEEAPERLLDLIDGCQMAFDRQDGQVLYLKPDFGSGQVRAGGVSTEAMREAFDRAVRSRGIPVLEQAPIVRLLAHAGACVGAVAVDKGGRVTAIGARAVVLANGGGSCAFLYHMNTQDLTFDGHGMALALGATLVNMEFYQLILGQTGPINRMILPESYLALGPRLTNVLGEEFLPRYLPGGISVAECLRVRAGTGPFRSDAAARYFDIALFEEIRQGHAMESGGLRANFTGGGAPRSTNSALDWYRWAQAHGVDIMAQPVDIAPHVHAFNGGLLIDAQAETTVRNLFACGEAAGGPHGANRIGGNQFAGSQVFGARAGRFAAERAAGLSQPPYRADQVAEVIQQVQELMGRSRGMAPAAMRHDIQKTLWDEMGVVKDAASLARCAGRLGEIEAQLPELRAAGGHQLFLALSLPHLLVTAQAIAQAALHRKESRGPHYRSDFPQRDDTQCGRPLLMRRIDGRLQCWETALP